MHLVKHRLVHESFAACNQRPIIKQRGLAD